MSSVDGNWELNVKTPMGQQTGTVALTSDGSNLTGSSTNNGETVDIYEGAVDGDTATWKADATKPFPMTLTFNVTIDGDSISGTAKAGAFPASPLTGSRQ
jgi:hypothetical protein